MPKKTKVIRIAAAGFTASDGRQIKESWLTEMAQSYNSKDTYGARIWLEHIRGITVDSSFNALGDVVSLFTQTDSINDKETLCLYAEIAPLPELEAINKKGQKIYTSIEVNESFANTGKAYLMGLAVTDSPASLGTEAIKFTTSRL